MAETLKLEIVTPQGTAFSEDVEMVTVPGADGEFGVYPHHLRLIAQVQPGELIVVQNGKERSLAVGEGFAEVTDTRVSILTDMAIAAEKIDEAMVQEARDRAEARLREKLSDEEIAAVNAALVKSVAQLNVKRRRRS
jgi:F-type H+-transporting ATPase subunit epsilon